MYLNYRKTIAVGGTAAAILGLGGTALAVSGTDTVHGRVASQAAPDAGKTKDHKGGKGLLKRLEHGQFVTKTKKGTVTHTIYRGTVTAVSATSITVQSADKKTQTYVVTKDTKIRERAKGKKPAASTIAKIAKGDTVAVAGIGTPKVTARMVVELPKK